MDATSEAGEERAEAIASKEYLLDLNEQYVCPDRVRFLRAAGIDLVIGRREGYRLWDLTGRELLDLHLNGGVYNLGHRNPALVAALRAGVEEFDIGNHHFPSSQRALLARDLVEATPGTQYAVFAPSGGEAVDIALKSARRVTGRRRIVSATGAYHGHVGLALAAGDEEAARAFHYDTPEVTRVPFNDVPAVVTALQAGDVAAVVLEAVPATAGFIPPLPGYFAAIRAACDEHGALLVCDEVQTGLGRSGRMWVMVGEGVTADAVVTGKGLSGGLYPMAAALLSERAGQWLTTDGWGHVSTFGGAELGCVVSREVLRLTREALHGVAAIAGRWESGLAELKRRHPQWLLETRQYGLIIGLRFAHEAGGMLMTRLLFDEGVWAMFAGFDRSVLQVKPGLLLSDADTDLALAALDRACAKAGAL